MMFDKKAIAFMRETCGDIERALDLVEATRDNRAICLDVRNRLKLYPERDTRYGDINRAIQDSADDYIHNLAFTLLMVVMGEHIPNSLYCYHDYSRLYENLGEKGEAWDDE